MLVDVSEPLLHPQPRHLAVEPGAALLPVLGHAPRHRAKQEVELLPLLHPTDNLQYLLSTLSIVSAAAVTWTLLLPRRRQQAQRESILCHEMCQQRLVTQNLLKQLQQMILYKCTNEMKKKLEVVLDIDILF